MLKIRYWPATSLLLLGFVIPAQASDDLSSTDKAARSGKQIVQEVCLRCHAIADTGAPQIGDRDDWQPRVAQGIDTLLQHALLGFKDMPPRASCDECSDAEIKAAIDEMVSSAK